MIGPSRDVSRAAQSAAAAGDDTFPAHCPRVSLTEKMKSVSDSKRTFDVALYLINRRHPSLANRRQGGAILLPAPSFARDVRPKHQRLGDSLPSRQRRGGGYLRREDCR